MASHFNNRIDGSKGFLIGEIVSGNNLTFNEAPSPNEEAQHLLDVGKRYLSSRSYSQAETALRSSIGKSIENTEAFYYLALAILRGRRPRSLHRRQVLEIEELMRPLAESNEPQYHHLLLLAYLKHDYYLANGQKVTLPSPAELLAMSEAVQPDHYKLKELSQHLPPSPDSFTPLLEILEMT